MNPYVILAVVVLWGGSVGSAFWYGTGVGKDGEIANQAENRQLIIDTREQAQQGAASEIAKLKPKYTTIQGKLETVVRENVVYRDCKHSPEALRLINAALTNELAPKIGSEISLKEKHEP